MGNPNVPCGGIPLLLCGDNHQKPPPGDVQWYVELVQGLVGVRKTKQADAGVAVGAGGNVDLYSERYVEMDDAYVCDECVNSYGGDGAYTFDSWTSTSKYWDVRFPTAQAPLVFDLGACEVEVIDESECPADANLPNCDDVAIGELCEGDGECGTDRFLNNCPDPNGGNAFDVYRKYCGTVTRAPIAGPMANPMPRPTADACGELVPVAVDECPDDPDLATCDVVACGELCEGDDECGTDSNLDNCDGYDIYRKHCGTPAPTISPAPPLAPIFEPTPRPASVCSRPSWAGDGYCDSSNNVASCSYDEGDCCASTCVPASYTCGHDGYNCVDPTPGSRRGPRPRRSYPRPR